MNVFGHLTSQEETLSVTGNATGPTQATFGSCNPLVGVIVQVLSSSILFTLHGPEANPDQGDFVAYAGDVFSVYPAMKLRMEANGSDSCVKLQGFVP